MRIEYDAEAKLLMRIQVRGEIILQLMQSQVDDRKILDEMEYTEVPEFEVWE